MQKIELRMLVSKVMEIKTKHLSTKAHAEKTSEAELRARVHQDKINAAKPESLSSLIPSILTPAEVAHLRKDSFFYTRFRRYTMFIPQLSLKEKQRQEHLVVLYRTDSK